MPIPVVPEAIGAGLSQRLVTVQQRNVMQPLIYVLGTISVFDVLSLKLYPTFALPGLIMLIAVLAVTLSAYIYFALRDPDRLQSEKYQLEMHQMRYSHQIQ